MTLITIDPAEMNAASQVLSSAAAELADVGSQLTSCVSCPMPPAVAGDINGLVGAVDRLLDRVGVDLHAVGIDLAKRGLVATFDSLAAATGSSRGAIAAQYGVSLAALGVAAPTAIAGSGIAAPSAFFNQNEHPFGWGDPLTSAAHAMFPMATAGPGGFSNSGSTATKLSLPGVNPNHANGTLKTNVEVQMEFNNNNQMIQNANRKIGFHQAVMTANTFGYKPPSQYDYNSTH